MILDLLLKLVGWVFALSLAKHRLNKSKNGSLVFGPIFIFCAGFFFLTAYWFALNLIGFYFFTSLRFFPTPWDVLCIVFLPNHLTVPYLFGFAVASLVCSLLGRDRWSKVVDHDSRRWKLGLASVSYLFLALLVVVNSNRALVFDYIFPLSEVAQAKRAQVPISAKMDAVIYGMTSPTLRSFAGGMGKDELSSKGFGTARFVSIGSDGFWNVIYSSADRSHKWDCAVLFSVSGTFEDGKSKCSRRKY